MKLNISNHLICFIVAAMSIIPMTAQNKNKAANTLIETPVPQRAPGQKDVLALRHAPIPTVRVGFIGMGMRGPGAVERFMHLEGVEVKAICDLYPERVELGQQKLTKYGKERASSYSGEEGWKQLCQRKDIDLVYIITPWLHHVPMALYAMQQGKHVAMEVPAAMSIKDCWALVDMAEKTQRHCMMLENCCYDFFEMATLNMAQQNVFGEVMHVEGAYIHDLRKLCFDSEDEGGYQGYWRLRYNEKHNGNPYPTHGLGPVCQILNIHRGDKMNYLVSMSSDEKALSEYAAERFGPESPQAKTNYTKGDMSTTLIRTQKGKTIMIQHNISSPRPYSRLHTIVGTKGFAQKYPVQTIALDPDAHHPLSGTAFDEFMDKWQHPLSKEIGEKARQVGGHGGMDFIMDYRLIYCLRNGLALDQDVYDAAEWSSLVELTEISVNNLSCPVAIPDFTRGAWDKLKGFKLEQKAE